MKSRFDESSIPVNTINTTKTGNEIKLTGDLTQATVMLCLTQSEKLFSPSENIQLNLSEVKQCDSASLSFLTALLRLAKQKKVTLQLRGMPSQMRDLASVSGLLPLLTLLEK